MKLSKKLRVIVAIIALAIYIFLFYFDYRGAYPGMSFSSFFEKFLHPFTSHSYQYGGNALGVGSNYIYSNTVGRVVVAEFNGEIDDEAITKIRVYKNKAATHFAFLWVSEGMDIFQLIQTVGTPSRQGTSMPYLRFDLYDNSYYIVNFDYQTGIVESVGLYFADDVRLFEADLSRFQNIIAAVYFTATAVLIAVIVLLITIPNKIRKRKAAIQGG